MRLLVALIIAVALAAWPGPGGHFAGARDANGGIDPALLKKAESGSKTAQKLLGMKYASGKKVAKDLDNADAWFRRYAGDDGEKSREVGQI